MENKKSLGRFITAVCGYSFFNKMTLLTPLYAIFMQSHGVSDIELSWLLMLYPLAILATQIPITWLTSRIGRRRAIILGQILKSIAFVLWFIWPTYTGFAIGMCLWGMQYAFTEPAFDALMYDELAARHLRRAYTRVLGWRRAAQALGAALSAFGSLMMFFGYGWVTAASVLALGISVLFIAGMHLVQPRFIKPPKTVGIRVLMRTGMRVWLMMPCVQMLMMLSLMVANFVYLDDYLSPIALSIGLPVEYVGALPFILMGCSVLGQNIAYKFSSLKNRTIHAAICTVGLLFALFSVFYSLWAAWMLALAYFIASIVNMLLYSRMQDAIPTRYRSLLLSLYNIGSNVAYVMVCLIIGLGGELGSWRYGILMMGIILIWTGVWAALFQRNECYATPAIHMTDIVPQNGTNCI